MIDNEADYKMAIVKLEELWQINDPTDKELSEFNKLSDEVMEYEQIKYPWFSKSTTDNELDEQ